MAIDTRDKRASIHGLAFPPFAVLPSPDGTIGLLDRVQLTYTYSGTDFAAVAGTGTLDLNSINVSGVGAFGPAGVGDLDLNGMSVDGVGVVVLDVIGTGDLDFNGMTVVGAGVGGVVVAPPTGRPSTRTGGFKNLTRAGGFAGTTRKGGFT